MYTKKERERYNEDRERACKRLGITKNQYNWLRRKGEALRKVYEDNCNGKYTNEACYEIDCSSIQVRVWVYIKENNLGLNVHYQTDPRGASLYLDKEPIPENNYTNAICIY